MCGNLPMCIDAVSGRSWVTGAEFTAPTTSEFTAPTSSWSESSSWDPDQANSTGNPNLPPTYGSQSDHRNLSNQTFNSSDDLPFQWPQECHNLTHADIPLHKRTYYADLCDPNGTRNGTNDTESVPYKFNSWDLLCADDKSDEFIVVLNQSNPEEHCDMSFTPDVCIKEGGTLRYSIRLGEEPATDVKLLVASDFMQTTFTSVFTRSSGSRKVTDWNVSHFITVFLNENLYIGTNYWMYLHHQFTSIGPLASADPLLLTPWAQSAAINTDATFSVPWSHARAPFSNPRRDRTSNNTISNDESVTAWQGGRFFSPKRQAFVPLSIPIMIRENDQVRVHPVLGEIGRKWRLNSWVSSVEPKFRGPFTVGPSFFDPSE